MKLQLRNIFIL